MKYLSPKPIHFRDSLRRATFLLLAAVLFMFSAGGVRAFADGVCPKKMSQIDCAALVDNWVNWVPDNGACSAGGGQTSASSNQSETQQIAQTFIIGFDASTPKSVITQIASTYHIGGMYVLGTKDAAADGFTKSFYDSLDRAAGTPLIDSSDEEGIIQRYTYPSGSFPSAASMANQSDSAVTAIGKSAGAVMSKNGLSADLAPVLDLRDVGIGGRSFSSNPNVVADKAGAFTAGLEASNITPIFKHFPGFDSTTSGNTDIEKVEMKGSIDQTVAPYKTLLAKYPDAGVMLSNMYVDKFDANNPASLSSGAVKYLRSTLNFKGMITTDDLSVSSVTNKAGSLANAVAQSLQAGVTMPLFTLKASSNSAANSAMDKIIAAVQGNTAAMAAVKSAQPIIDSFKGGTQPDDTATTASSTGGASCCAASATTLSGGDHPTQTWNYFKGKGLDDNHVAAIMGNFQQESGFNPEIVEGNANHPELPHESKDPVGLPVVGGWPGGQTRQPGYGLAQWTPSKKIAGLFTQNKISSPLYDMAGQLDLIWAEMNGTSPTGATNFMSGFKSKTSLADATQYFVANFEGPLTPGPRLQYAQQALQKYGGKGGGQGGSSGQLTAGSTSSSCAISPDCVSANGVAKILCAAKRYDPVSYQESSIGGHQGAVQWHKDCPTVGPSCYLDCSGLVNIAVYDVTGVDLNEVTSTEVTDTVNWKKVSFSQLQPGDLIQPGEYNGGHVEIVDHVVGNTVFTFGAHTSKVAQPKQVGPSSYTTVPGDVYLHYTGKGI
jgi:beta-N-acetylhexosaminidase